MDGRARPDSAHPPVREEELLRDLSNYVAPRAAHARLRRRPKSRSPPSSSHETWPVMYVSDMASGVPDSTITELSPVEEPLSPRSARIRRINLYMAEHTFDDLREAITAAANGFRKPLKNAAVPDAEPPKNAAVPDAEPSKAKYSPHELDAQSFQTPSQTSEVPQVSECLGSRTEDLQQSKESLEEIIQNGKRWMSEEVMLAFEKYIEGREEFKDLVYGLDELQHQCFNVETYHKIFHHYNFTVKMKKPTSDDWSSTLYFAEVKEMCGRKFYFCRALEPNDNGYCYACKNQGMDELKHPADHIGIDIGLVDTECPFIYMSDSDSDDDRPRFIYISDSDSDDDRPPLEYSDEIFDIFD